MVFLWHETDIKFNMSGLHDNNNKNSSKDNVPIEGWITPQARITIDVSKQRKCGHCGVNGHNKRTCPMLMEVGKLLNNVLVLLSLYT